MKASTSFLVAATALCAVADFASRSFGPLAVSRPWLSQTETAADPPQDLKKRFPTQYFETDIDHLHNETAYEPHTTEKFKIRYWFNKDYYKPGGPVIAIIGGEAPAIGRLLYIDSGVGGRLAKATNGIAVLIEHRYYGESFPVKNLTNESLRFLSVPQALADLSTFAKEIKFAGVDEDVTAPKTPWIAYGGSYSGALVTFLRKLYPDVWWGAISSSGVPEAVLDYWQYNEAARLYAPKDCVETIQNVIQLVDGILLGKDATLKTKLKVAFGFTSAASDRGFAEMFSGALEGWQGRHWHPKQNSASVDTVCANLRKTALAAPSLNDTRGAIEELVKADATLKVDNNFVTRVLNWKNTIDRTVLLPCKIIGTTPDKCISSSGRGSSGIAVRTDIKQTWRSWPWQLCTQWGFFMTGNATPDIRPITTRLTTLEDASKMCKSIFNRTLAQVNTASINQWGGVNISYPRLAHIDGESDPWKWAGPHAPYAAKRPDTIDEPFVEIEGAGHHWDTIGLEPNEVGKIKIPEPVAKAQEYTERFVKKWVSDFVSQKKPGVSS